MKAWTNEFLEALKLPDQEYSIYLLEQGFPLNFNINEDSPLTLAIKEGKQVLIDWLLRKRVNIKVKDKLGRTPLLLAAEFNNLKTTQQLIEMDADVRVRDYLGNTVVHLAASQGNLDVLSFYVQRCKFPVNVRNHENSTPLDLAKARQAKSNSLEEVNRFQRIIELLWMNQSKQNLSSGFVSVSPFKTKRSGISERKSRSIFTYLTHRKSMFYRGFRSNEPSKLTRFSSKNFKTMNF